MKAYKCDICNEYCDDVFTIHGISNPNDHTKLVEVPSGSADCCVSCYDDIMLHICNMIK